MTSQQMFLFRWMWNLITEKKKHKKPAGWKFKNSASVAAVSDATEASTTFDFFIV